MENKTFGLCLRRLPDVCRLTGLRKSSIYAMINVGSFPAPVRIGPRAVAWRDDDIGRWIETRLSTVASKGNATGGRK
ncbi:helix-turn-helix transcriptional regulator [Paraburkholderia sp. MM5482-R1]|uniref:helix-turn-helix transcriptional regulator n=1 Tax=unclassified Paraburkholderia TaxID=2615204 RepID=UPI003D19F6AA